MDAIQGASLRPSNIAIRKQTQKNNQVETPQVETAKSNSPSGATWQAMVGINTPKQSERMNDRWAVTGKIGKHDVGNRKKAVKEGNAQAENVAMLLT